MNSPFELLIILIIIQTEDKQCRAYWMIFPQQSLDSIYWLEAIQPLSKNTKKFIFIELRENSYS